MSLDNDKVIQLLTSLMQGVQNQTKEMQNQAKEVDELKKQMGQVAEFMGHFREQGKLPSSTIVNPRGKFETANAITLRSGKEVGTNPKMSKSSQVEDEKLQQEDEILDKAMTRVEQPLSQPPKPSMPSKTTKVSPNLVTSNVIPPNVPFPRRFMQTRNEEEEKDIMEKFRKVHVNIPLLDAVKQIPK